MSEEIAVPGRGSMQPRSAAGSPVLAGASGTPVYRPGELGFRDAVGLDEAWAAVSPAIRERLGQRAGTTLERWAWLDADGSACAIVLGSQALVSATPTTSASGRPAHTIETVRLATESARVAKVNEDTAGRSTPRGGGTANGPAAGAPIRLPNRSMQAFLGHLPNRAQQMLQEPFLGTAEPPRGDHHYLQTSPGSGFGRQELRVFCYLFDARWLTCVTGEGVTYGTSFAAAGWDLTCRRVAVRPK